MYNGVRWVDSTIDQAGWVDSTIDQVGWVGKGGMGREKVCETKKLTRIKCSVLCY